MRPCDKGQGAWEGALEDLPDRDWLHHMADTRHASMEADEAEASGDYLWGYWLNSGGASPNLDTLLVCGKEHSGRRVTLGLRNRPSTQSVTSLLHWRQSKGCDSGVEQVFSEMRPTKSRHVLSFCNPHFKKLRALLSGWGSGAILEFVVIKQWPL